MYFDVGKTRKEPDKYPLVKQFIAWCLDKHYLVEPDQVITPIFDMSNAGISNVVSIY